MQLHLIIPPRAPKNVIRTMTVPADHSHCLLQTSSFVVTSGLFAVTLQHNQICGCSVNEGSYNCILEPADRHTNRKPGHHPPFPFIVLALMMVARSVFLNRQRDIQTGKAVCILLSFYRLSVNDGAGRETYKQKTRSAFPSPFYRLVEHTAKTEKNKNKAVKQVWSAVVRLSYTEH